MVALSMGGASVRAPGSDLDLSPLGALVEQAFAGPQSWHAEPMPGGASTRRFFRVYVPAKNASAVAFFVPDATRSDEIDKTDGARQRWPFVEVHELLRGAGVRVPALLADGSGAGWLLVEDLGDDTLAVYLAKKPTRKEELYRGAVRDLAGAQAALARLPAGNVVGRRSFDEDLLNWELRHFCEWALDARGRPLSPEGRASFDEIGARLARRIAGWPRGFVHRDYQSRNLMVHEVPGGGELLTWIDFQDALLGPRVYDLVALLNDSYQVFDRAFVEARLDDFAAHAGLTKQGREELGREFDLVTVQRKLKDAGRFVYLERVKNNPSFLPYVEPTIAKARATLARLADDEDMRALGGLLAHALDP